MDAARSVRRNLGLVAVLVVGALALASCGEARGADRPAATVNGTDISQDQVESLVNQQIALQKALVAADKAAAKKDPSDPAATAQAKQSEQAAQELLDDFEGSGAADSYGTVGAAQVLTTLVDLEVQRQVLREAGAKVEQSSIDELMDQVKEQASARGLKTIKPFQQVLEIQAEQQAIQTLLRSNLKAALKARDDQRRQVFDQQFADGVYCVRVIQSPDQASSQAAIDRVAAGEDFVAVAGEVSTIKDQEGALDEQCDIPRGSLVNVFGEEAMGSAQPGAVLGPADGGQGADGNPAWLAVRVESVETPSYEDLTDQIEQMLVQQEQAQPGSTTQVVDEAVAAALQRASKKAEVEVNPRFGTWNARTVRVDPPFDPAAPASTTVPSIIAPEPAGS